MNTSNQNTRIKRVTDRKIVPFLWFEGNAEEAVSFYHSVFDGSKPGQILRYDQQGAEASGRPAGSIMTIEFVLEDTLFTGLNGEPPPCLSMWFVILLLKWSDYGENSPGMER